MVLKVGDKIICNRFEGMPTFVHQMEQFVGKTGIIKEIDTTSNGIKFYQIETNQATHQLFRSDKKDECFFALLAVLKVR